jgi:hypothetical protein
VGKVGLVIDQLYRASDIMRGVKKLTYWGSHCDGVVVMSGERA